MKEKWKAVAAGAALLVGSFTLLTACSGAGEEETVGDIDEYCASIDMDDDICAAGEESASGEAVLGTKKAGLTSLSGASTTSTSLLSRSSLSTTSLTSISRASLSAASLSQASASASTSILSQ